MAICMHFGLTCQNWTSGLHYWQTRGGSTLPKVAWLEAGPLWANSALHGPAALTAGLNINHRRIAHCLKRGGI